MWRTLGVCAVLSIAFASMAGLWGLLVEEFIQFGIAMTGSFAAAYFALRQPEVGGLAGLVSRASPATLGFLPDFADWPTALAIFVIPLTVQWW
jgi:solute:Na+ symporter, SSS family